MATIDLYTRVVLTVIAAALVGLLVLHAGPAVSAQDSRSGPTKVVIVGWQDPNGFIHPLPRLSAAAPTTPWPLPVKESE